MKKNRFLYVVLSLLLITSFSLTACSQDTPAVTPAPAPVAPAPAPAPTPAPAPAPAPVETNKTASGYPNKPINAIVGFPPGGPTDVIARGIIPVFQELIDEGIGITNMPGAASATAAINVVGQPTDGYTLFFGSEIMSVWQTMGTADLAPTEDFIPIKLVSEAIPVLAVPPDSKFNTAEEFIQYAIDHPKELTIGTAGPATVPHISGLLLQKELGCEFTFVPFQGGGPAVTAVMGSQVDGTIEMVQSMSEAHKSGKVKILASFTNEPIEGLDIPAIGAIIPELSEFVPYGPYFGLFAAKGTPPDIIEFLREKMDIAMKDQRWDDYCKKLFLVQIDYEGEAAVEYLKEWTSRSAWLLFDTGGAKNSPADFGIERLK